MKTASIAIVGMACIYPDARSPEELWENALAQRRAFRRIPSERLNLDDYYSPIEDAEDLTYATQAAVIDGYEFDRVKYRVAGSTYRSADLAHWLALDVASLALADAGFPDGHGLPKETTGVVVGNTLTGEFSRAGLLRLRWPYVRRTVASSLRDEGWTPEQVQLFLSGLETQFKAPFPSISDESLAGGLANTIAGRICNHLDLKGGGYTVDGACASSLLAITNGCSSLLSGDLDMAIVGGVDLSLDPFELVGFAKTGALARDEMRVYDAHSAGFWPGEGCGFVILAREEDALAQDLRIYATIRGWGVSSDGSGGITRPEVDGQILAVERAYRRAGFGIDTIAYFEGHGTGTAVGDATELRMLSRARREANADAPAAAIGSVKANIGHTKAAAGIAGIIKATMALYSGVLPPTTGSHTVHPELTGPSPALRVLPGAEAWPADAHLRAGISAMGFGGINTHIVVEREAVSRSETLGARARSLAASTQDAELFLLSASDVADMQRQTAHLLEVAPRISRSELADLAAEMQRKLVSGQVRASVVAAKPAELTAGLGKLHSWLDAGETHHLDDAERVFLGSGVRRPRLGFLFPGQGVPATLDGGIMARRFDFAQDVYRHVDLIGDDLVQTSVAQPAIVAASLAGLRLLARLEIEAELAVGHSLGELSALSWAGAMDERTVLEIASRRGRLMAELGDPDGTMAYVRADQRSVTAMLNGEPVTVACVNSPTQTIISGPTDAVDAVVARARTRGLTAARIAVSHAFHSPLMTTVEAPLRGFLAGCQFDPVRRSVVSTVTGRRVDTDVDIPALLGRQVTEPVRFTQALATGFAELDLLIEVGPGHMLSGLVRESLPVPVVAMDTDGISLAGVLQSAGMAYVLGAPLNHGALFADRFTRPFDLHRKPLFFVNPCELAPEGGWISLASDVDTQAEPDPTKDLGPTLHRAMAPDVVAGDSGSLEDALTLPDNVPLDTVTLVRQLVADRTELPLSAINVGDRLLSELHLNSITVSQLVADAARRLDLAPPVAPTEYADVTVETVAEALDELARSGGAGLENEEWSQTLGVDSWVRPFTIEWIERALSKSQTLTGPSEWTVIGESTNSLVAQLQTALGTLPGSGVVVCCPQRPEERALGLLLAGVKTLFEKVPEGRFVLVQHGGGATALAKTLHLERPTNPVCVVDVPADNDQAISWIVAEAANASGYSEACYDADGRRTEPVLRLLPLDGEAGALPLEADDVLLVTGGGKGITAECALSLARTANLRLVLLGRSRPDDDAELSANLERMRAAGVRFHYIAADVTDADSVNAAVSEAEEIFGPIRGILHGAARNVPQLLHMLDEAAFRSTLAPKTQGVRNLLAAVDPGQLRLFIAFGSIIARTGLPGEADYGLANEWMERLLGDYRCQYPACRWLTVEWSVWAGAGMGARLGRLDTLARQGISPIPLDDGIDMLHRLLASDAPSAADGGPAGAASVVVTGRFGAPPTLRMETPEIPFWRFLEEIQIFYPGVELVVDATLSADTDPYLAEHVYRGEPLLPAVIGLEAMAQAAMALTENAQPPIFRDVHFNRPVTVAPGASLRIRLAALKRESGRVEVVLRSEETGFQVDHFSATCDFSGQATPLGLMASPAQIPPVDVDPTLELYADLLFQRGRFQRIRSYQRLAAKSCLAEIGTGQMAWFSRYLPPELVLGDPGSRDATLHAIQVCVPHATLLPVGVDELVIGAVDRFQDPPQCLYVYAEERYQDGDLYVYDVCVSDDAGQIVERWNGLRFRVVGGATFDGPWPIALVGPYLERRVGDRISNADVRVAVVKSGSEERPTRSDAVIRHLLGERIQVLRRPDGRPEVEGVHDVSVAHAGELTMAVVAEGPVGCDMEPVEQRPQQVWLDLLGAQRFSLAQVLATKIEEDFDAAATRVWTAVECLRKAGAALDAPLLWVTSNDKESDDCVVLSSGELIAVTVKAQLRVAHEPMVFAVMAATQDASQHGINTKLVLARSEDASV